VPNTVHHRRLACCSTQSIQPSDAANRRFGLGRHNTGNIPHQIGLIFLLLFLSRKKVNDTKSARCVRTCTKRLEFHRFNHLASYASFPFTFFACAKKVTKKAQPI
jgi:hypothetical protein